VCPLVSLLTSLLPSRRHSPPVTHLANHQVNLQDNRPVSHLLNQLYSRLANLLRNLHWHRLPNLLDNRQMNPPRSPLDNPLESQLAILLLNQLDCPPPTQQCHIPRLCHMKVVEVNRLLLCGP
jgi:hypothetical protein